MGAIELPKNAKIVVNDLGGTTDGQGNDSKAADTVVAEILAISRFDRLLGVFPSVRGAIELFSAAGLAAFDAAQPPPAR
jgi:hypothetical protein